MPVRAAAGPETATARRRLAGSTVRSVLDNPRYTGYAIFGRWAKHEMLLDPEDVAAGHVVRFRRANPDRVVRSRQPGAPRDCVGRGLHPGAAGAPVEGGWRSEDGRARPSAAGGRPSHVYLFSRTDSVRGVQSQDGGKSPSPR